MHLAFLHFASCQFVAKEWAQSTGKVPKGGLARNTDWLDMTSLIEDHEIPEAFENYVTSILFHPSFYLWVFLTNGVNTEVVLHL